MKYDTMPVGKADPDDSIRRRGSAAAVLSVGALLAGVLALSLAILPAIVLERPAPIAENVQPADDAQRDALADPVAERGREIVLQFKDIKLSLRRDANDQEDQANEPEPNAAAGPLVEHAPVAPLVDVHEQRLRRFALASAGCAMLGLFLGPLAWARGRHRALAGSAMAISGVALLWQYIVAGIVIAIVIVLVLTMLAALGTP